MWGDRRWVESRCMKWKTQRIIFLKKNSNKRMCYVIEFSLLAKRMLLSLCMAMWENKMKNKITYTHIYTKHETIYMLNWTRVMTQWVSTLQSQELQSQGWRRKPVAKTCPLTCSHVSWHAHYGCLTQVQQLQGLHALNHWKRASTFLWERGCLSESYVASILLGLAPFVCFLNLPSQCMTVVFGVDLSLPPPHF